MEITTGMPTLTFSNSSSTSGMCMRRHPWLAAVPIDESAYVPWMPMAGAEVPIHRVPRGFPGPGGMGPRPLAHGESGGFQVGFVCLLTTR